MSAFIDGTVILETSFEKKYKISRELDAIIHPPPPPPHTHTHTPSPPYHLQFEGPKQKK